MIIDEIKLKNVGVFSGLHSVELTPPSPEKNIILFGGMNGAGKTTLLDSIQVGLFGQQAVNLKRATGTGYEKHLRKLISRSVKATEGASIEVSFRIKDGGALVHYRLIRSWAERRGKIGEKLEVFVDHMFDAALSDSWGEEVERFLSPRLSHLFFFDGEKIESLADPETSTKILETAIVSLLGVDLVDQLNADLKILIARKRKEALPESNQEQVQLLEADLNSTLQQRAVLKDALADLMADLDHAKLRFSKAESVYAEQGGELFEQGAMLKADHANLEAQLLANRMQLRQVASGPLPLHMLSQEIDEIRVQAESETIAKNNSMIAMIHQERDAEIIRQLTDQGCAKDVLKGLSNFLDGDRESLLETQLDQAVYNLDESTVHLINQLCEGSLNSSVNDANSLLIENTDLEKQLAAIEKKLSRIPDEEQIRDAFIEMRDREKRATQLEDDLLELETNIEVLARKENSLVSELERILGKADEALLQSEEQARVLEYSKKAQSIMSTFKVEVIKKHASRLEILIADSFKTLLRKQRLIDSVKINPNGCALSLFNSNGEEVLAEGLSAGERQLLATSILWALAKASGSSLPVVIDTPLGRLDSAHRGHLLERYFPEASHQVILLSTDEEIDLDAEVVMGGKVGRHYLLNYDDMSGGSSIQKGYFGGELS